MEELSSPELATQVDVGPNEVMSKPNGSGMVLEGSLYCVASGSLTPNHDDVLQTTSSTRNSIFYVVPTQASNAPASENPSKRMRVTPSPTDVMDTTDTEFSPDDSASTELPKKRLRTTGRAIPDKSDMEDDVPVASATTEVQDIGSNSNAPTRFRVRIAHSSSYKCRRCLLRILKNHPQVSPTITCKPLWYHVSCAKDSMGANDAREMEGFLELSADEQEILCELLTGKRVYTLWYEKTRRTFCCDCTRPIFKGMLRIAECRTLGRKDKYTVYHHVQCATFPLGEIKRIQDFYMWPNIKTIDQEAVLARLEEKRILLEKENQALEPDALVQTTYQGATLPPPHGLRSSLLPFQVEGFSWMVHQELHAPEIRGGILADEMVGIQHSK